MSETKTVAGAYAKIESHEELCAERYAGIHSSLSDLKGVAKAQANVQWGVLLALLGFMAIQVWNGQQSRLERLERPAAANTTTVVTGR